MLMNISETLHLSSALFYLSISTHILTLTLQCIGSEEYLGQEKKYLPIHDLEVARYMILGYIVRYIIREVTSPEEETPIFT